MSNADDRRAAVADAIERQGLVAIVRSDSTETALSTGRLLVECGARAVEVSMTTPDCLEVVRDLAHEAPAGAWIGVGTLLAAADVRLAERAGASFVVSPNTDVEVITAAHDRGMLCLPGAATPTEVVQAVRAGTKWVKLFPAALWGVATFAQLRAPLPDVNFVPTGGVAISDVPAWWAAGAPAVGLGSPLTRGTQHEVRERMAALLALREQQ